MSNFIEEVTWRGMLHDVMPGTEEHLQQQMRVAYLGIDPTADSLHVGHLVGVMLLKHFQNAGHKPIALIGGATGMIGDPSGKSDERKLLNEQTLRNNQECIKKQLAQFLDFSSKEANAAELVNNYDWMKTFSFLNFIRDIGKHLTVNYMMSKDSVKKRINGEANDGMSFTEFSYQLVQGYDFLHLYKEKNCSLQMGGSDQWGNITTGSELIRRKLGEKVYALTCPLITKTDGTKFGKSEKGNVWLDPQRTTPYEFYQFWLNVSDEDARRYIKIFTLLRQHEIEQLIYQHDKQPHLRLLQKTLSDEITTTVHGNDALHTAIATSNILFGQSTVEDLKKLSSSDFTSVFSGIPKYVLTKNEFINMGIVDALATKTGFLSSNSEARRELKANAISVNKTKVDETFIFSQQHLLQEKYVLLSKGKKQNFLLIIE